MPLIMAFPVTDVNWMVIVPELSAVVVNGSTTAMSLPPAVAKISKLLSTWRPLIATLNDAGPLVLIVSDAPVKLGEVEPDRVAAPGVRLGIV